jgi:hypothetical protein
VTTVNARARTRLSFITAGAKGLQPKRLRLGDRGL